jgi:hypothetical protein
MGHWLPAASATKWSHYLLLHGIPFVIPPDTEVVRGPAHGPSARPMAALETLPRKSPPELWDVVSCRRFGGAR